MLTYDAIQRATVAKLQSFDAAAAEAAIRRRLREVANGVPVPSAPDGRSARTGSGGACTESDDRVAYCT